MYSMCFWNVTDPLKSGMVGISNRFSSNGASWKLTIGELNVEILLT